MPLRDESRSRTDSDRGIRYAGSFPGYTPITEPGSEVQDAISLDRVLPKTRLFRGLSRSETFAILARASHRRFSEDQVVTNQGDPADRLFLVVKGSARYFFLTPEGRKVYLLWLVPGDIFGGASLLTDPADFLVSTEVTRATYVLVWPRNAIRWLAERHLRLLENTLSIASDYLTWYLASHLSLICHTARQRLAHVLISLGSGIGYKSDRGISLQVTNEQLANTASITPFTVSRLLNEWQRSGAIRKGRGKLLLVQPDKLF